MKTPGLQPVLDQAAVAVAAAAVVARATGARRVASDHLVAALAELPLSGSRRVLRTIADLEALGLTEERAIVRSVAWGGTVAPRLRHTRELKRTLELAWVDASAPGLTTVDQLAALATSRSTAGDRLRSAGATPERVAECAAAFCDGPEASEPWRTPGMVPLDGVPAQADVVAAVDRAWTWATEGRWRDADHLLRALSTSALFEDDEVRLVVRARSCVARVLVDGPHGGTDVVACRQAVDALLLHQPSPLAQELCREATYAELLMAIDRADLEVTHRAVDRLQALAEEDDPDLFGDVLASASYHSGAADDEVDRLFAALPARERVSLLIERGDVDGAAAALVQARRDDPDHEVTYQLAEAQLPATAGLRRSVVLSDIAAIDENVLPGSAAVSWWRAACNANLLALDDAGYYADAGLAVAQRHGLEFWECLLQRERVRWLLRAGDVAGARRAAAEGVRVARRRDLVRIADQLEQLVADDGHR